ncbi:histidinol phosphate phosphatase domain-containing protein [bacterium]|nr:histidinol phosphate phosphatase domain-containing protein [bacterium]
MISLHTHTFFSDGELGVSELVRRAEAKGYRAIGVTDHVDNANLEFIISSVNRCAEKLNAVLDIKVVAGVEITHVPPVLIPEMIDRARKLGAKIIGVHGETIIEPVITGTNRAAISGGVDFLAHPGLISAEDAALAAEKGIYLEITTRKGHAYTNGHVLKMARIAGAKMIINTDSHSPSDLVSRENAELIARGAGLTEEEIRECFLNSEKIVEEALS